VETRASDFIFYASSGLLRLHHKNNLSFYRLAFPISELYFGLKENAQNKEKTKSAVELERYALSRGRLSVPVYARALYFWG
jgi:hypothetical protein